MNNAKERSDPDFYLGHGYESTAGEIAFRLGKSFQHQVKLVVRDGQECRLLDLHLVDFLEHWTRSALPCGGTTCTTQPIADKGLPEGACATEDCCNEAIAVTPLAVPYSRLWLDAETRCVNCLTDFHRISTPTYREPTHEGSRHHEFGRQYQQFHSFHRAMVDYANCDRCQREFNVENPPQVISGGKGMFGSGVSVVCLNHVTETDDAGTDDDVS